MSTDEASNPYTDPGARNHGDAKDSVDNKTSASFNLKRRNAHRDTATSLSLWWDSDEATFMQRTVNVVTVICWLCFATVMIITILNILIITIVINNNNNLHGNYLTNRYIRKPAAF